MKVRLVFTTFLLISLMVRCSDPNFPPTVVSVSASSALIEIGQEIELLCLAHDLDGDTLTFTWSSPAGTFKFGSENDAVLWVAPTTSGNYQIEVQVSDGKETVIGILDVLVIPEIITGEFTDERDGMVYTFASIGTQVWMTQNLAWLPFVYSPHSGSEVEAQYYVYGFEKEGSTVSSKEYENYLKYGVLYNHAAALTVCPEGWQLPSNEQCDTLINFLGTDPGYQMKSQEDWSDEGFGSNSSRFNALPAGYRHYNWEFGGLEKYAYFWTSSTNKADYPIRFYLTAASDKAYVGPTQYSSYGFSVRCIKK